MTNEYYRPKNFEDAVTRLIEECSEVQKICCKIKRFGAYDKKPGQNKHNLDRLIEEFDDVKGAWADLWKYAHEAKIHPPRSET